MDRRLNYTINDTENILELAQALSSKIRLTLFQLLIDHSYSINELAEKTNTPISTTSFHLQILKKAGLIKIIPNPTKRGNEKVVSHVVNSVNLDFRRLDLRKTSMEVFTLPVGSFTNAKVVAPCGLADANGIILKDDQPGVFYSPRRFHAELVWFTNGYVEYILPNYMLKDKKVVSVSISLELCSECPNYREDWKSNITFWINGQEVCTYLSPGDFGKHRGKYTPANWSSSATQYGLLKQLKIDESGTYIDENAVSSVRVSALNLLQDDFISLKIGFKDTSKYIGGVNIFGAGFGDFDQDIIVSVEYQ